MIAITGGAGFIGSALVAKLNQEGIDDILVVDDLSNSDTPANSSSENSSEKWRNLSNKQIQDYLHKDQFLDGIESGLLPDDITAVIHLGACSSTTETNAEYMMQNNYRYSKAVASWAADNQLRFIYASSAAVYGDGNQGFSDDHQDISNYRPLNVYGLSKHLFDHWAEKSGLLEVAAGIRFFNVYGPNEYHKGEMRSVVVKSFEQIQAQGKVKLFRSHREGYADGEQRRDFIYVKDCCEVLWQLLNNSEVNGILNLGTGKSQTWNQLTNAVFAALGKKPDIEYIPMPEILREKYQYFTEAKMDKLAATGWVDQFHSLEDGVKDYVVNYLLKNDVW